MPDKLTQIQSTQAVVDTDLFATVQNMASTPVTKGKAMSLIKTWLKTYFDTLYGSNVEGFFGFISSPSNKDYRIVIKSPFGGTITETTTRCASGTATFTFKINTTALGGTANSVSSSEQSQTHSSNNVFAAGDDIVITVSAISACVDATFNIKFTKSL